MSRSLDIVTFLRSTEIDNPNNNALISSTSELGGTLDSAAVQGIPMQYFETLDSLPMTNLTIGLQAFVEENRRHYVSNGSGWYNTGYSIGASPYWDSDPLSTYEIVDSQTPLIVIAKPQDSDTANFINQSFFKGTFLVFNFSGTLSISCGHFFIMVKHISSSRISWGISSSSNGNHPLGSISSAD